MKPDMIDRYRAVQKYRGGEWKVGDRVIHDLYGPGIVAGADDSLRLNVTFTDCKIEPLQGHEAELLWLPPVWSDDGRCLWAILKDLMGGRFFQVGQDDDVFFVYYDNNDEWFYERIGEGATLPEALLRAIKEQEADHE